MVPAGRARASAAAPGALRSGHRQSAGEPTSSDALRRDEDWRKGRPGSARPVPHPASALSVRAAVGALPSPVGGGGRGSLVRRARSGRPGRRRKACRCLQRSCGSSPRPPPNQRASHLQGSDLTSSNSRLSSISPRLAFSRSLSRSLASTGRVAGWPHRPAGGCRASPLVSRPSRSRR